MSKKRLVIDTLCIIAVILMMAPIFIYSMMAIPFADDFSYASNTREAALELGGVFRAIIYRVYYEYLTLEGGMYKVFCMGIGSLPLLAGGIRGLRIYIAFMHLLFYIILFILIKVLLSRIVSNNKLAMTIEIYTAVVFWLINNQLNEEMYTWALIQSAYVLPIITMFLGMIFFVLHLNLKKDSLTNVLFCVLAAFLGFLASGAPFDIAVLNCGLFSVLCYYAMRQLGKGREELLILGMAYLGALINFLSPGNGLRHGDEYGARLFVRTLLIAFEHTIYKLFHLSFCTPFLVICIVLFFLFYYQINFNFGGKITYKHPVLFLCFLIIGITMTSWPYTFGNSLTLYSPFEGRVDYVLDIGIYMSAILWLMYYCGYVRKKYDDDLFFQSKGRCVFFTALAVMFVSTITIWGTSENEDFTTKVMYEEIIDSTAHQYSDYQEEILQMIEGGEDDVYVYYDYNRAPKTNRIIVGLRLTDADTTALFWRNNAVARFYGKQHVFVVYPN